MEMCGLIAKLKKKHHITYDSEVEDAFNVHMEDGIIKFEASPEDYIDSSSQKTSSKESNKRNKMNRRKKR